MVLSLTFVDPSLNLLGYQIAAHVGCHGASAYESGGRVV